MSNRPTRARPTPTRPGQDADRRRTLLIAGGAVLLVVLVGLFVALAGDADEEARTSEDKPAFGPVEVDGSALPDFEKTEGDAAAGLAGPVVQGTTPDGDVISVGGPGEPSLVVFLAHWCPHCQAEVPVLVDLMAGGDLDGVRTVAVLTGTTKDRPNFPPVAWLEREDWAGEVLLDDDTYAAGTAYGLTGFPYLVVLDADGKVVARASGEVPADQVVALVDQAR